MNGALADSLRWVATLAILGGLTWLWYMIVSRLTPFEGELTPKQVEAEIAREVHFARLRRVTVGLDVFFFFYIVIEGAVLPTYLFVHFGLR
jgi:hypothetical protein